MIRDWPDMSPSTRADSMFLYRNGYQNGFYDSSWTADVMQQVASANNGMRNGAGLCANIHAGVSDESTPISTQDFGLDSLSHHGIRVFL